ncbi:MAG: hypothetical protein FWG22_02055 [Prolixibacteraceae bacterium]|nr:hypothetical protein [Prolixibacteraceae bacterium]
MKKVIFILLALMMVSPLAEAQQKEKEKPDFEKFKSHKISFITEKLNLTPQEAEKFWPVYNQFEKEKMDCQNKRRELERMAFDENKTLSSQEIIKTIREISNTYKKENELNDEYNEKFLKVLSPQKVLLLYRAEGQFRAHMFEQFKKRNND